VFSARRADARARACGYLFIIIFSSSFDVFGRWTLGTAGQTIDSVDRFDRFDRSIDRIDALATHRAIDALEMDIARGTCASSDGWLSSVVFKLVCGFWFALGAVFGRQYALMTGERTSAGRATATAERATASATTTSAANEAMEVEMDSDRVFMDESEAESSFVRVDEMMEDAFEEEAVGESTPTFVAPGAFASSEERAWTSAAKVVVERTIEVDGAPVGAFEPSTVDDLDSSAEEGDESDSAETKDKLQFVNDQVLEAEIEGKESQDEVARARAEADKIEWERRRVELEKQAEEARKKKAALKKSRRVDNATEAFRKESEVKAKEADDLNRFRIIAQEELKAEGLYNIAEFGDLVGLLSRLKTHEDGKNIETSYKKALLKFHPDRSAARGGTLNDLAKSEETFKLLQACRKVWENMGKPLKSFTREQPSVTRSWSRGNTTTTATTTTSNQSAKTSGYDAYRAGQQAAQTAQQQQAAAAAAEFVQKAKKEAHEAEARMREEAALRTQELHKLQREKVMRESKVEEERIERLQKARERDELLKKLEEIKRANGSMPVSFDASPSGERAKQTVSSGTKTFLNVKPGSPGALDPLDAFLTAASSRRSAHAKQSTSPGSPQSREETLGRL